MGLKYKLVNGLKVFLNHLNKQLKQLKFKNLNFSRAKLNLTNNFFKICNKILKNPGNELRSTVLKNLIL